jgi:hypothetical protein
MCGLDRFFRRPAHDVTFLGEGSGSRMSTRIWVRREYEDVLVVHHWTPSSTIRVVRILDEIELLVFGTEQLFLERRF